jgi:hypothetical protein
MEDPNGILTEALLDDVLNEKIIAEAIDEAFGLIQGERSSADRDSDRQRTAASRARTGAIYGRDHRGAHRDGAAGGAAGARGPEDEA